MLPFCILWRWDGKGQRWTAGPNPGLSLNRLQWPGDHLLPWASLLPGAQAHPNDKMGSRHNSATQQQQQPRTKWKQQQQQQQQQRCCVSRENNQIQQPFYFLNFTVVVIFVSTDHQYHHPQSRYLTAVSTGDHHWRPTPSQANHPHQTNNTNATINYTT